MVLTIMVGCVGPTLVSAADKKSSESARLEEWANDHGVIIQQIPLGISVDLDYVAVTRVLPHPHQLPIGQTVNGPFVYGDSDSDVRVGITEVSFKESDGFNIEIALRLENGSRDSLYFLTGGGSEHPFEIVLVTPQSQAYFLTDPIVERMESWRRLVGASVEPGKCAEFKFKFRMGREAITPGQYLLYAVAKIPKGEQQESRTLWSPNMLFTLTPEQTQKIITSSSGLPERRRASASEADPALLQAARQRQVASVSGGSSSRPAGATSATVTNRLSWPAWVAVGLLALIAAIVFKGILTRRKGG
jgi:hypothetical protein